MLLSILSQPEPIKMQLALHRSLVYHWVPVSRTASGRSFSLAGRQKDGNDLDLQNAPNLSARL